MSWSLLSECPTVWPPKAQAMQVGLGWAGGASGAKLRIEGVEEEVAEQGRYVGKYKKLDICMDIIDQMKKVFYTMVENVAFTSNVL